MRIGFKRLTTGNVEQLLRSMQEMAARGPVRVTPHNILGALGQSPIEGKVTFSLQQSRGEQILVADMGGIVMNMSVNLENGKTYYQARSNVVTVLHDVRGQADSWRIFTFAPS